MNMLRERLKTHLNSLICSLVFIFFGILVYSFEEVTEVVEVPFEHYMGAIMILLGALYFYSAISRTYKLKLVCIISMIVVWSWWVHSFTIHFLGVSLGMLTVLSWGFLTQLFSEARREGFTDA